MRALLGMLFCCWAVIAVAQSGAGKRQAAQLAESGKKAMAEGDLKGAAQKYAEARKLDKENASYRLSEGEARFYLGELKQALKLVQPVVKDKKVKEKEAVKARRLYSGCLALQGKTSAARKSILKGLEEHPKAGELYAELGILAYEAGNDKAALEAWENGMRNDAAFPGNYLAAGKILAAQGDLAWAIIYLEQYLNLQKAGSQAKEVSILMMELYRKTLVCPPGEGCGLVFYQCPRKDFADVLGEFADAPELHERMAEVYGGDLRWDGEIGIGEVHAMLREATESLAGQGTAADRYFLWLDYVEQEGALEAYVYWMLQDGAPLEFGAWFEEEADTFAELEHWLGRKRMIYNLKEAVLRPSNQKQD